MLKPERRYPIRTDAIVGGTGTSPRSEPMMKTPARHSLGVEVTGLVMMTFVFVWYGLGSVLVTAYGVVPGVIAVIMNVVAAACGFGLVITWRNFVRTVRTPPVVPT